MFSFLRPVLFTLCLKENGLRIILITSSSKQIQSRPQFYDIRKSNSVAFKSLYISCSPSSYLLLGCDQWLAANTRCCSTLVAYAYSMITGSQSLLGSHERHDVSLKSRQRVKPRAEASIDSTPISLVFTLFMHDQVINGIDIVTFFCPLLFCIIIQTHPHPQKWNDLKLQFSIESFYTTRGSTLCPLFNPKSRVSE